MLEHLSPERPACMVDGRRPASQSKLADLLRLVDARALRDLLVAIADDNAFSWDAYTMLGRVAEQVALQSTRESPTLLLGRQVFQPKHGTAERWYVCDCADCVRGLEAQSSKSSNSSDDHLT